MPDQPVTIPSRVGDRAPSPNFTLMMPIGPAVIISDGVTAHTFSDLYDGEAHSLRPIERAVTVARLRTLADLIEGSKHE